jgi:hypothetical protein
MNEIKKLILKLGSIDTPKTVFNPYKDVCNIHDKNNAPAIRRKNLEILLNYHYRSKTNTIWIFEANSYQGGRRSGVPFVNELMYEEIENILGIKESFKKATKTNNKVALTTKMAWNLVKELNIIPFMWESASFHFYNRNNPFSNRPVTKDESILYKDILMDVLNIFKPKKIISVGRSSERILNYLNIENNYVRHPAHGGFVKFKKGIIKNLY